MKKPEKNAQIIRAATQEFLSKGLDAASMQNISVLAEVSKRTLYKYYPTKDDLYNGLVDEILDRVSNMLPLTYDSAIKISDQIEEIIEAKMKLTLDDDFLKISKIVTGELLKKRTPTASQLERFYQSESMFIKWLKEAQKDGKVTQEVSANDIATQFHSFLKGQIYWPVLLGFVKKEDLDLVKIKNQTIKFFTTSFSREP